MYKIEIVCVFLQGRSEGISGWNFAHFCVMYFLLTAQIWGAWVQEVNNNFTFHFQRYIYIYIYI